MSGARGLSEWQRPDLSKTIRWEAVIFELAKWLLWVELFDRDDRQELATELLQAYVLNKHNGHVSRLN